ncbi:chromate transporter [Candidatus Azobacteroides pseudotrichonymphae]|uniref:chromate transporter n=1 Tax=Candidatus Azobacteroides pseudotrichonymphae TaxID=511435 RepID=UPI0002E106B6|nr:chromate transporter [Candidatus Azobacteroides pseudotrichonymphae]
MAYLQWGGGYAMLPLIHKEVVEQKQWISQSDFVDMIALSQSIPGIWTVNIATFTGHKMKGIMGSIIAVMGATLPSFVIILIIAKFFQYYQNNLFVIKIFKAIRPAIIALIVVSVFTTAKTVKINLKTVVIPITVTALTYLGISPIYVILLTIIVGLWCGKLKKS